jgi:aspartate racemase
VRAVQTAADDLISKGAGALLVACTELSIVANELKITVPWYDSAQVLADAIVQSAKGIDRRLYK